MGADYYSYAVIGIEIDPEKLVTETEERGCDCKEVPTGKFCSSCGATATVKVKAEDIIWEIEEDDDFHGYKIIFGTDREKAYISAVWAEEDEDGSINCFNQIPNDIEGIRNKMKDTLDPLGLWDEKKFGLYSVLYCSY